MELIALVVAFTTLILYCDGKNNPKPFMNALRSTSIYCNEKYITNCSSILLPNPSNNNMVSLNVEAYVLQSWSTNLTLNFRTYEWKQEKYQDGFINFDQQLCFLLENERWLFPLVRHYSNLPKKCPVKPGILKVVNLNAREGFMPTNFPPARYRFSLIFKITSTGTRVAQVDIDLQINTKSKTRKLNKNSIKNVTIES